MTLGMLTVVRGEVVYKEGLPLLICISLNSVPKRIHQVVKVAKSESSAQGTTFDRGQRRVIRIPT